MSRRIPVILLFGVLAFAVGCTNKKVNNPLSNVGSKQPDKVLFDRAMDAMKHNRFDVARITLQTMINTYPDSEFIARAKLAVADSWYAEGDATSLNQAEIEYKDFETFFPNMPEAAEAQLKIANIHYQEMEKPDRDYTHAMRAEEEYRQLILQYPDNKKVVEEGKKRLMEVQEVIAEREYRVGRFYFLRQSYPAAIARLRSWTPEVDTDRDGTKQEVQSGRHRACEHVKRAQRRRQAVHLAEEADKDTPAEHAEEHGRQRPAEDEIPDLVQASRQTGMAGDAVHRALGRRQCHDRESRSGARPATSSWRGCHEVTTALRLARAGPALSYRLLRFLSTQAIPPLRSSLIVGNRFRPQIPCI